ncbi:hypothetical protein [Nocardioides sp. W7]|uniref:hypothetical protein n=1 Tax=Nocardioides sp. W7 TaxID=2931390 RepID=UPI001FD42AE6|nr:hypothetical protein [Nocardioides sp. W7]
MNREPGGATERAPVRRLRRVNLVSALAFILGGSLFALGALLAQLGVGPLVIVNLTYLVGGFFFSLGGYASILLVSAVPGPRGRAWLSAVVLFVGTLLFAVSLVAAFAQGLTPRQSNGWIWFPDILGCVCFLASGHLAMLEVGAGHLEVHVHELAWWVVAINQVGSVVFFLAGIAAFTRPATSSALDAGLVNWGTFIGAVCFAVGGFLQLLVTPTSTRTAVQHA